MISNIGIYDYGEIYFETNKPILNNECVLLNPQFIFQTLENNDILILNPYFIISSGKEYRNMCAKLSENNMMYSNLDIFVFDHNVTEVYMIDYLKRFITKEMKRVNRISQINFLKNKNEIKCELIERNIIDKSK
jgi:hypothetical protein